MLRFSVFLSLLFFSGSFTFGQITINNTGYTVSQLVNTVLVPSSSGVTVSNVTFKGVYNNASRYQVGAFTTTGAVQTNLGFSGGVILSSGNTADIPLALATNPGNAAQMSMGYTSSTAGEVRDNVASSTSAGGGDNDARALTGSVRNINTAVLEFDFVPVNSSIMFRYVFGSEEYEDASGLINYNCSSYNDKFAFLISGPGINGGTTFSNNAENIARLGNNSQVAINAVNNGVVGSSGGSPNAANCTASNPAWVQNSATSEFNGVIYGMEFNGTTKILVASKSGLTPGSTYHIRLIVTDAQDGAYDSAVLLEAGSFTSPSALPVEWTQFEAHPVGEGIVLNWSTASEFNHDYFSIEHSQDGVYFQETGVVEGNGNTTSVNHYEFTHLHPFTGSNYYRIKQVDFDGNFQYSPVLKTEFSDVLKLSLYPNPVKDKITIGGEIQEEEIIYYKVCDQYGKVLESGEAGMNQALDMRAYRPGMYFVKLQKEGTQSVTHKVIKE